ncbi:1-acyl-sn-glycerol-3-phosphate acyltransferase [Desulfonema ishimotonii]|uniref:1-acyl-sn-glycerol-3-phosphate acyltransferase n=1 Tax=Desulfonema ishimotonii TaxID=45657 RepID=UPI00140BCB0A|nr:1-acyl-sn-glycerol-3-phosphate acyltransferase [Desulfonema ishimotonii]
MSRWLDKVLQNTPHHYRCYYPKQSGVFSSWILRFLFSGIRMDKAQQEVLRGVPEDGIIVYVNRYKSYFEYLFYHTRYAQEGLPVPEIGLDYKFFWMQPLSRIFRIILSHIRHFFQYFSLQNPYKSGYIRQELTSGKSGLLSLVEEGGFYLRFVKANPDPLHHLLVMQHSLDRPVYIVPQLMFYSKKPCRVTPGLSDLFFGSQENPGKIRRLIALLRKPESVFVEISEPVSLRAFIDDPECREMSLEKQALRLRRHLLTQINRHRQSITGPVLKSQEELKENILTNDRLRGFMQNYAGTRSIPLQKVHKEADACIDEIAARYSLNKIQIFSMAVSWLIRMMFEGVSVNTEVLNRVKGMSRRGPLVLVPCHKSHIDYLVLSYIMYHNDMPCPHIAAGKNLSFWPMGPIFRGAGAFFIRRSFKGAVLYSRVFSEYVYKLMQEGFNIEFFIEGGRSRTGKLLQPKLGLLSIMLKAFRQGACEDLIFVPVFIGYDRVPEEGAYLRELEGGQKKPESLLQILKARKVLKKRYGRIYIQFHDGISMNDLLDQQGARIGEMTSKEQNRLCRNLGYMVLNAIDRVTVITPHAIVAGAILNTRKQRFSYEQLMANIEIYMNFLTSQDLKLADTLLVDPVHTFEYVIESYGQRKFIEPVSPEAEEADSERWFMVNPGKRPALEYYKNNCVMAFIPAAFTALAILDRDAFQFSGADLHGSYAFLLEFFSNEFSSDIEKEPEYFVQKNIKAFIDEAILMPHPTLPDTYNLTSAGFRKLKLFAAFLIAYFESYMIALNFFMRYPKNFVEAKDRVRKIQSMGNRMYKKKEITRPEALSRISYKNALDFFISHGIRGSEDVGKIKFYADTIRRCLDRLQS